MQILAVHDMPLVEGLSKISDSKQASHQFAFPFFFIIKRITLLISTDLAFSSRLLRFNLQELIFTHRHSVFEQIIWQQIFMIVMNKSTHAISGLQNYECIFIKSHFVHYNIHPKTFLCICKVNKIFQYRNTIKCVKR